MQMALETNNLGKRYDRTWVLRNCTIQVPAGSVAALVGPNGAGKTTLMQMAVGLVHPTEGEVLIAGLSPWERPASTLESIGFVGQDHPLYRGFSVADMLLLGRRLNVNWDHSYAVQRMEQVGISLRARVGSLSGGQQAQVALTMALAKRPRILLLDEPVASLDPLARRNSLRTLVDAVTEGNGNLTVLLSSHIMTDLERVCDYLILLDRARVRLVGTVATILAEHRRLIGPAESMTAIAAQHSIVAADLSGPQANMIVRISGQALDSVWEVQPLNLEEIVIAYMEHPATPGGAFPSPSTEVA